MEGARSIWTVLPALKHQAGSVTEIMSSNDIFEYSAVLSTSLRLTDQGEVRVQIMKFFGYSPVSM